MKIAVRGFAGRHRVFEEIITLPDDFDMGNLAPIVARHVNRMAPYTHHMIEIEFLEEPDELRRFFRIGSDPNGMVHPLRRPSDQDMQAILEKYKK